MLDRRFLARPTEGVPTVATSAPRWARAAAEDVVRWLVVILGLTIPVSVVADNILLAVIAGAWIFGGGYREKLAGMRANPVALAAIALFGLCLAGTLYSIGSESEVLVTVTKGARLLLIP